MMLTLIALLFSGAVILFLCARDPKRLRAARAKGVPQRQGQRRLLTALLCAPGLIFALGGDSAAFMMWLGGVAMIGWIAAQLFGTGDNTA